MSNIHYEIYSVTKFYSLKIHSFFLTGNSVGFSIRKEINKGCELVFQQTQPQLSDKTKPVGAFCLRSIDLVYGISHSFALYNRQRRSSVTCVKLYPF